MLSRAERLKYNGLFLQAYEKGKRLSSKNFHITFTKTRDEYADCLPLTGFVVSKKFHKRAVIRNKYKRAMREIYRLYRLDFKNQATLKSIGLLVISLKTKCETRKDISVFNEYREELTNLLNSLI